MTEVYRLAREVVVWLGPGGGKEHNDEAFALFPLIGQIGKKALKYQMDTSQPEPDFSMTAIPEASLPVWSIISDVLFHEWFARLWIVQGFALSQSTVALVGDNMLDFNVLEDSLGGMMSIFGATLHNLEPGVRLLQDKAIKCKFDIPRLINKWSIVAIRGYVHETTEMIAQQVSPLHKLSAATTTPRKRFATADALRFHDYSTLRMKRRHWNAVVDRYHTWKRVSAPRGPEDVRSLQSPPGQAQVLPRLILPLRLRPLRPWMRIHFLPPSS